MDEKILCSEKEGLLDPSQIDQRESLDAADRPLLASTKKSLGSEQTTAEPTTQSAHPTFIQRSGSCIKAVLTRPLAWLPRRTDLPFFDNDWAMQEHMKRRKAREAKWAKWYNYVQVVSALHLLFFIGYWLVTGHTPTGHGRRSPAQRVLENNPLIDGHNDLLILLRVLYGNQINDNNFTTLWEKGGLPGHVDIPRLEAGKVGGSFWSAFVPCPANGSDFSNENYAPYVRATLEQIDLYNRLSAQYPKYFTPTPNAHAAASAFKHNQLISPLAIEGLHQIGNSASTLRLYHSLGVRYATLTWNCHNPYADAALVSDASGNPTLAPPLHHGVSPAGRLLIREMNRLGMLVDLSHTSPATMRDALGANPAWPQGSLAPPIFSHSSAYALCPHPRNVPDDVLDLVKARNGLVMVNFAPDFISCKKSASNSSSGIPEFVDETNTIERVVEHVLYIGRRIGFGHVGLGTDFDGIPATPRGLEDVSKFPDLVARLLQAGVSEADAGRVVGRNLLRVWAEADRVAEGMRNEGVLPLEDVLERRMDGWGGGV